RRQLPEPDHPIAPRAGQQLAVGADRQGADGASVRFILPRLRLPRGAAGGEQDGGLALDVAEQRGRLRGAAADELLDVAADLAADVKAQAVPGHLAVLVLRPTLQRLDDVMEEDAVLQLVRLEAELPAAAAEQRRDAVGDRHGATFQTSAGGLDGQL